MSVFLVLVLVVSGALLMFYYVPTPESAGPSIQTITFLVPYGNLIRNLHYWSAQALVVVALLHLLRVVLTGAYAPPRRFNYLLGLGLLVASLLLDFTGYILRWDEGIQWALVVGANLIKTIPVIGQSLYGIVMGGQQPGPATLIRFYAWHIFGLTLVLVILGVWHLFRVRRDGGIAAPPPPERTSLARISRYELVRREALAALLAGVVLTILAFLFPAPLAPPIGETPAAEGPDSSAPWFFLWVQQLLKVGDPFVMGVVVPILVVAALGLIPYLLPNARPPELGRWWPAGNRLAQVIFLTLVVIMVLLTITAALTSGSG